MIETNNLKQIIKFKGEIVQVKLNTGVVVEGILGYYDIDKQLIHLNKYREYSSITKSIKPTERGEMIVINKDAWETLKVKGDEYVNG